MFAVPNPLVTLGRLCVESIFEKEQSGSEQDTHGNIMLCYVPFA